MRLIDFVYIFGVYYTVLKSGFAVMFYIKNKVKIDFNSYMLLRDEP